ncbi:hypothetical protein P691DRAFT_758469 [Macrolepiota fuliginosa MF-IS2]|uniref:Uncharacterized protein n=1 Tax=Macrolepiota fuliginosa MF-IS2 TaxID=1400762 RepID=A0A9P5XJ35_9AGAR|nr:hypothetical protein P691DRAFT_758469 [Macrolepiota fuliginosa MF-IS2]
MDLGTRTEDDTTIAPRTGPRREEANNAGDRVQDPTAPLLNEDVSPASATSHRLSYADPPPQTRLSHRNPAELQGPGMNHDDDSPEIHAMSMVQAPPGRTFLSNANQYMAQDSPIRANVELQHPRPRRFIRLSSFLSQLSPRLAPRKNL